MKNHSRNLYLTALAALGAVLLAKRKNTSSDGKVGKLPTNRELEEIDNIMDDFRAFVHSEWNLRKEIFKIPLSAARKKEIASILQEQADAKGLKIKPIKIKEALVDTFGIIHVRTRHSYENQPYIEDEYRSEQFVVVNDLARLPFDLMHGDLYKNSPAQISQRKVSVVVNSEYMTSGHHYETIWTYHTEFSPVRDYRGKLIFTTFYFVD